MSYPSDLHLAPGKLGSLAEFSRNDLTRHVRPGTYAVVRPDLPPLGDRRGAPATGPDRRARSIAALEDWTGSFDMHLGVHTRD